MGPHLPTITYLHLPNQFGKKETRQGFFSADVFALMSFFVMPSVSWFLGHLLAYRLTMIANISAGQLESYFTNLDRGFPLLDDLGAQVVWGRCNLNIWINGACHIGFFSSAYHSSDSSYTVPRTFWKNALNHGNLSEVTFPSSKPESITTTFCF